MEIGVKKLVAHPLAEKYPLLEGAEYETFKADIEANGCHNPVWLYEGKILDGRNRYRACREIGIEPVYAEYDGEDPAGFVESQNEHRRHLTAEWRRAQVKEKRAEGKSTRQIAEEIGVAHSTVVKDLNRGGSVEPPATAGEDAADPRAYPEPTRVNGTRVQGRDGKTYAATKPRRKRARRANPQLRPEVKAVVGQLASLTNSLNNGRGFWADARTMKDTERWQLADKLEALSKVMARRATELRNKPLN